MQQLQRLEKEWENFTHCLRDNNIPPTSNKVEQYYAETLNWVEKNDIQSEDQFYRNQKFNLISRYGLPLFEKATFANFIAITVMLHVFLNRG